eukprot:CAMPEP_0113623624 /NCGR_PEP_ID=MMETSP0017_2-20120614/12157_1 /TAXON_ID=2856 /ORGANISM="Cylindrotheca closterium" /LENGTH=566 /DNA_ID=CAMNT_0000533587 /DNA_START=62 /DNA_END=1762 /DNA_ORIENTATION=+ /assembly_acc=CAM_ASM_000147
MPPKKKARLKVDPDSVFVVTTATTKEQVPKDVRVARVDGSVRILPDDLFKDCFSLEEVIFEEGVHCIGRRAFWYCIALAKVKLPSTLREILNAAFSGCESLCSIDFPLGLKVIGDHAFSKAGLRHLGVPDTVETIGNHALRECLQLQSIVLPRGLVMIAAELFYNCHQLRQIQIPSTVELIGIRAFFGCSTLQSLDLSHCIHCVAIYREAFTGCEKLSVIDLPPNLESIPSGGLLFTDCKMLTHIRMPPNVASNGNKNRRFVSLSQLCATCSSLVSLELPEGLEPTTLVPNRWRRGISDCSSLVNLYMPLSHQDVIDSDNGGPFPDNFELAKVATDWCELVAQLQQRFDGLPLHRLCYFHGYHHIKDTIETIRNILQRSATAGHQVDVFGMTPLHLLSLAQKPVVKLLQEIPTFTQMALSSKDLFGSTPLDYLCKNPSREGMDATRWMVRIILEARLPFLGLDQWKQELLEAEEGLRLAVDAVTISGEVGSLVDKLARLEFLEVLSLLEMVLWRIKLDENVVGEGRADNKPRSDRESCRVQCGISIVVGNVLPFLGREVTTIQSMG